MGAFIFGLTLGLLLQKSLDPLLLTSYFRISAKNVSNAPLLEKRGSEGANSDNVFKLDKAPRMPVFQLAAYAELELYSAPASPEDVTTNAELAAKAPIGSHHYRAFVGPPAAYADMSGLEFSLLYFSGLKDTDSLLDIGCGSLRLGRMALAYLLPGRYHCIEPNSRLVRDAIHYEVGEQMLGLK